MTKLLIVESPSKAKTIGKYLGVGYEVVASVGHIRDLPKSNKQAVDIDGGFIPRYEIVKGKEKIVSEIKNYAKTASQVLLATDPDREGEAIAWHIEEACGLKKAKRIVFYEITENAIKEALNHPREIDTNLRKAQEARRVLDRLVGYDLSGLIWKKVRYGLSAGRVQSPSLRIIMEREREIRTFVPEKFWRLKGDFKTKKATDITLSCDEEPRDEVKVEQILKDGRSGKWSVVSVSETEVSRGPKAPFITSTLQQTASTRFGLAPSHTMSIAQKLYEKGLITYMRTDSTNLSLEAQAQIASEIGKKYGKEYVTTRVFKTKSKNAQEAHEAIRPTHIEEPVAGVTDDEKRLYKLIWARTVASQMTDAKILRTKISANIPSKSIPNFSINGGQTIFPGWLKADPEAAGDDVELPKVATGETLSLIELASEERATEPPARYTEAGLIKELEKRGIGRPSTYASIMKTLVDRGYVERINRTLFPTDTGDVVSTFLENNFANYISDSFTAEMEDELDDISNGKRDYTKTLKNFYGPFNKEVKSKEKIDKLTTLGDAPEDILCPKCGSKMIIKLSKTGKFLSCRKYPECVGARKMDGIEMEGPKETGEDCPTCKKGKLVEREGRFGKFVSCANYPKCKFIKKSAEEEERAKTGIKCPKCKDGEMVARRGRFGVFYSCSNYPTCKYAIKAKPTGEVCKLCGDLMMDGTKTIPERCSNKLCINHNPHKLEGKKK
ncbi:MAG: type I DNA topoisomerase [Candidatus Paceibacterota bacterium]|jgi:DNA topoisomerase-1